ncbi:PREDICTED: probable E3 ubiquitin-protein ligase RHB1A [Tarenaya hassleriana]|uniref:probable E3 ubiquitin-protein ligase RHB1A n=1 Tax=Tarenaya hassleriana TaxID=28532 RepID=UPI00053C88AB|nr:PREDICTED: probable E3 ubiquitin-protein ligase RHB1A [Tarenaya hassleriana]XP_010553527.1 PREDICTED: probable E3 ubiquitin-protein ligase RHB1A [Tarenaya hassleriana]XP_010553528.1 PREDICTED: probable E3 ubiquitin-protein ligase RHB1A [Tarenaya hassleriana]XP_010553531.1 PREDICTED: probable E3 ubiquitin-protein ligase RHB1A [Tarenaya hassleriana]XP_019059303.1 PREDICTED: probable E3 ubiquitin-protein ligase RHB1A [Tarenaya hassleriana]
MGGCCCCSSRSAEVDNRPAYYYYPRATEERVPLSSHNRTSSGISSGVLVDTNLETSSPDAYIPPPLPLPFDVALGHPQTPRRAQEICADKRDGSEEITNSDSAQGTVEGFTLGVPNSSPDKETDCKLQTDIDLGSVDEIDPKISKQLEDVFSPTEEEDCCPICLEEYDIENPKLHTNCEHHFHLACILEWMERSETCPVCDKEMVFDSPMD